MADLLQGVQEGAAAGSGDIPQDFKMPSTEELLKAIENMAELSEDQKKELVDSILARQQEGGDAGFAGFGALPNAPPLATNNFPLEIVWMLSLLSIVFLILVFFGYKLYKSLVERDRRREEKKRQKLQKKKK
uniref:Uncharacterized protein n=1 Tax=Anoplophora glabripennis TaxID=217634 RepID=V5GQ05_ANOGL